MLHPIFSLILEELEMFYLKNINVMLSIKDGDLNSHVSTNAFSQ